MVDARRILDALVGASAERKPDSEPSSEQRGFLQDVAQAFGGGRGADLFGALFGQATGGLRDIARDVHRSTGELGRTVDAAGETALADPAVQDVTRRVREAIGANPGMTQAALIGAAGLLLGTRRGRGLAGNLVGLGGLALISGLAYRAFRNYQAGRPAVDFGGGTDAQAPAKELHPASATEEDALLFVRAMIAASAADGHMDQNERERVVNGLTRASIDGDSARWLEQQLAHPATPAELARDASSPAKAAQVYAAARIAIEPDTAQERDFLRQLADALKLTEGMKREIDEGATGLKTAAAQPAA